MLVLFCSQCVPQHVPNSALLHLISFALIFILVTFISSPKGGHYNISILGPYKALLNFFGMDKSTLPIGKERKRTLGCSQLLNLSHNILLYFGVDQGPLCQFGFARKPYLYGLEPKPKDVFFQRLLLHYSLEK